MNSTTTLRVLNDITGTDQTVEVPRDRAELIISLLHVCRIIQRQEKIVRLAVHLTQSQITLHWWVENYGLIDDFLDSLVGIPRRTLELLQKARVGA